MWIDFFLPYLFDSFQESSVLRQVILQESTSQPKEAGDGYWCQTKGKRAVVCWLLVGCWFVSCWFGKHIKPCFGCFGVCFFWYLEGMREATLPSNENCMTFSKMFLFSYGYSMIWGSSMFFLHEGVVFFFMSHEYVNPALGIEDRNSPTRYW